MNEHEARYLTVAGWFGEDLYRLAGAALAELALPLLGEPIHCPCCGNVFFVRMEGT